MPRDQTFETAIHEAGHTVVGWLAGYDVASVSIVPIGPSLGRTAFIERSGPAHPIVGSLFRCPSERAAARKLAGPYAEHLFAAGPLPRAEHEETVAALQEFRRSSRARSDTALYAETRTLLITADVGYAIFDIAEALLRHRDIRGQRVHEVLGRRFGTSWRATAKTP